jgi:KaiC/GvpD/RAD55 family RecA-like ATPase
VTRPDDDLADTLDAALARRGVTIDAAADRAVRRARLHRRNGVDDEAPVVRALDVVMADALPPVDAHALLEDELVEGILARDSLAVIYGESNCGKTFLALDLAASVSRGVDWLGLNAHDGLVVYLAAESPASVRNRARAYMAAHACALTRLAIVMSSLNFFAGDADVTAVLAVVARLEAELGEKVVLLVVDTLARVAAGANENAGEDMGLVVRRLDALRAASHACVLLVHHCGKDAARGMRGWSGLRAAIDTEIDISKDSESGAHVAEVLKQRDLSAQHQRLGFRLEPVAIGRNRWGAPRTSCVAHGIDAPIPTSRPGKRESEVDGAILEVLSARGDPMRKAELAAHLEQHTRSAVYRRIVRLADARRIVVDGDAVRLPARSAP